jgi:hypothetical protein
MLEKEENARRLSACDRRYISRELVCQNAIAREVSMDNLVARVE